MDEQRLRTVLTELADAPAPPSTADPAVILRQARRSRSVRVLTASAVVVVLLCGVVTAVRLLLPSPSSPAPTAATTTYPMPASPAFVGPYCGWSTTLPGAIERLLPHVGTWGTPQPVSGLCSTEIGTLIPVTVNGRTGTVQVVVSTGNTGPGNGCVYTGCQQIAGGSVGWDDNRPLSLALHSAARLATASGLLIDIQATNEMFNYEDDIGAPPVRPAMPAPPYTGRQLSQLAITLSKTNWVAGH